MCLLLQGMLAAGVNTDQWDCVDAVQSVLDGQGSNGEINSLGGTLQILPLLASKTFADVKNIVPICSDSSTGKQFLSSFIYFFFFKKKKKNTGTKLWYAASSEGPLEWQEEVPGSSMDSQKAP